MKKKIASIACLALSIVLMALPYGVAMEFAPSPTEKVTNYYSYFSMMPFGYGNWYPIITAILSIIIVALFFVSVKKNVGRSIEICLGIAVIGDQKVRPSKPNNLLIVHKPERGDLPA